jgi:hypothetical protein
MITQNLSNFGNVSLGLTVDTISDAQPFVFENVGNVYANISNVSADDPFWASVSLNTSYFQYKADNSSETPSFNWSASQTTWQNMSDVSSPLTFVAWLNYREANDEAEGDFRLTVPGAEPTGKKSSTVRFWFQQS